MEKNADVKVTNILLTVGITPQLNGFRFLREAILLAAADNDLLSQLTKKLYPSVACKYLTSISNAERDMRHAIEIAFQKGQIDALDDIIGVKCLCGKKPTVGEFVSIVAYFISTPKIE